MTQVSGMLAAALVQAIERLRAADVDNPQLDARLLTCRVLGIDRAQLVSQADRILTETEAEAIDALITRREKREPLARIIGAREFWGLSFELNEATLEPRPDSECLIEAVLHSVDKNAPLRLLDIGTGTGCLLLSLLHELSNANGLGVDIAPRAVEQATANAAALKLAARASFRCGNWLENIADTFDVILSNPPYIPSTTIPTLMPEVRLYDPPRALDGGEDGLGPYRLLIPQLPRLLAPHGLAAFELGQGQAPHVAALFQENGFTDIRAHKDLAGIERCVTAGRPA